MSRQSSITLYRCRAEFKTIWSDLIVFAGSRCWIGVRTIIIILSMGMIELRGVLSSWATDEKNIDLTLCINASPYLNLVISVHIAMICSPLLMTDVFTWIYLLGCLALNTVSTITMFLPSCMFMMWFQRFYFSSIDASLNLELYYDPVDLLVELFLYTIVLLYGDNWFKFGDYTSVPSFWGCPFSYKKNLQMLSFSVWSGSVKFSSPTIVLISLLAYVMSLVFMSIITTPLGIMSRVLLNVPFSYNYDKYVCYLLMLFLDAFQMIVIDLTCHFLKKR